MITSDERVQLLRGVSAFSILSDDSLHSLASHLEESNYTVHDVVITEGEIGDRAYLIVEGRAEVTATGVDGSVLLASLSTGELFGELALLNESPKRSATVTATSPLTLLSIKAEDFRDVMDATPEVRRQFHEASQVMMTSRFLKLAASPFATLPPDRFQKLVSVLTPLSVAAHSVIVRQGEEGHSCYILQEGQVEVVLEKEDGKREVIATLGPGTLFGEAALLTESPRNSTVIALTPCTLLELRRSDLIDVMETEVNVGLRLRELLQTRARPRQLPNIESFENISGSGETIVILKDRERQTYYRLSHQGWFIWKLLDGDHSLKDLTLAYMTEFKAFAPQAIIEILSGLSRSGFICEPVLRSDMAHRVEKNNRWQRLIKASRAIMECEVTFKNVDPLITRLYNAGVWILFTRPIQILLATICVAGIAAFIAGSHQVGVAISDTSPWLLLFMFPAEILCLVIHECGHAFTTKAFGREVHGVGIGWYWYSFIAFVNTSDMWLAKRWQRVMVSIAGPYTNLIIGSLGALISYNASNVVVQVAFWQFALASYIMVLLNLNPLLEYDGYYILSDLLDKPNLRQQLLGWLGHDLIPSLKNGVSLSGHYFDVAYGIGSIIYTIFMATITVLIYRVFLEQWLSQMIPHGVALGMAWVFAAMVVIFSFLNIIGDLRGSA